MTSRHGNTALGALAAAAFTAVLAGRAAAQENISTDRPGLGFAATVPSPGAVQIEQGLPFLTLTRAAGTDRRVVNFPGLLRVGVTNGLELRLGSPLVNFARTRAGTARSTSDGFGPVELGGKLGFGIGHSGPSLAIIPSVILPLGDEEFAGERASYTTNAVAAWSLPQGYSLNTVAGLLISPSGNNDHTTSGAFVGTLGHSLSSRLAGYAEAAWYPVPDAPNAAYAGVTGAYLVSERLQLDAELHRGLTKAASDWLIGVGISARL